MPSALPQYYSSLAPFRAVFATGLPILTYHKLGPRPRCVRLKGLYLSARLFERQLAELRAAGFASTDLSAALEPAPTHAVPAPRRIVITFDDGFRNVLEHGLPVLLRYGFTAIQFLVADLIGRTNAWEQREGEAPESLMDEAQVREWLAAGMAIGSHTRTHPWLTRLTAERAREEIAASKRLLEDRFGVEVEHFCYPYGDHNPAVCDLVAGAGYRTASTVEPGVNTAQTPPHALRRFTARYASRNLKAVWQRLRRFTS